MFSKKTVLVAALLAATAGAQAADFYVGGSVGSSKYHADDDGGVRFVDKTDTGYKAFGGVQIIPNFAVEFGYVDMGKLRAEVTPFSVDLKGRGVFVDAVGLLPVTDTVTLFGKVGAFNGKVKGSVNGIDAGDDSGTDVKFGLGASFAVTPKIAIRAEWERYRFNVFDDKGDTDLASVGVSFKF